MLKDVINAQSYEVSETIRVLGKDYQRGFLNQITQYSEVSWKLLETLFSRGRKEANVRMFA